MAEQKRIVSIKNKKNGNMFIVKLFTLLILFTPQMQSYVGLALEQALTLGVTVMLFLYMVAQQKKTKQQLFTIALIYLLFFVIDLLRSLKILIINDFFELIKPFSFSLYFMLGYSELSSIDDIFDFLEFFMKVLFIISVLGILESRVPAIDRVFLKLYKSNREVLYGKAVFSFISPYCFAALLIFPIFYSFFCFFALSKYKYLFYFFVFVFTMLLTQSKTVLLGFVITFLIMVLIVLLNKWVLGRRQMIVIAFAIIAVVTITIPIIIKIAQEKFAYLYEGLSVFFKALKKMNLLAVMNAQPTTRLRYEQLMFAIDYQDTIPLIGVAIGKGILMPESFYALYLFRTGLIGITIHVTFVFFAAKKAFYVSKYFVYSDIDFEKKGKLSSFYFSLFIFFISLFFSYFSGTVTDTTRIGFCFYLLIGSLYSIKYTKDGKYENMYSNS